MGSAALKHGDMPSRDAEPASARDFTEDPRWQLIERILESEPFQKSSRLPALLRYLARCTIAGDRIGPTEQRIGRAVFHKPQNYTPAEDSSVRVYVRQLRLRLHEYYQSTDRHETLLVSLPKGGYTLAFTPLPQAAAGEAPLAPTAVATAPTPSRRPYQFATLLLLALTCICSVGWYRSASSGHPRTPWPLNQVMGEDLQTTLVLADATYSLRLLGDEQVPLDRYIDRTFYSALLPRQMSEGEHRLLHYLEISQITSMADADAAAALSALAPASAANLAIRSAKNLSPGDLSHGNFIYVGAKTSNPWVELFDDRLNFQFVEGGQEDGRYILNRRPQNGERSRYAVAGSTGSSGEDYATITLLPARNGNGNVLLLQGLRMEGTQAVIDLIKTRSLRDKLQQKLMSANGGRLPAYFEVLIHAQSVAGAPVSVDLISVRAAG